jgi:hypothetical protein
MRPAAAAIGWHLREIPYSILSPSPPNAATTNLMVKPLLATHTATKEQPQVQS